MKEPHRSNPVDAHTVFIRGLESPAPGVEYMPFAFLRPIVVFLAGSGAIIMAAETVVIDGSSTVYPISLAVAEQYNERNGGLFEISVSGTTAGMRLFTAGKIPIAAASRPIRAEEVNACDVLGIHFVEIPVALDGVTVAVNKRNTFIDHLTIAELKRLWEPDSRVKAWSDLRPGWPNLPVALFGPGHNSGTFDFFTEVVVGKAREIREDFTASEDDNDLVQGVVSNTNALAYFGWSYFQQNSSLLRSIAIDGGHGPISPSQAVIIDGSYAPLSRPLFYYVAVEALDRPEVLGFLIAALDAPSLIQDAGYVPLSPELRTAIRARLDRRVTGSLFVDRPGHPRLTEVYLAEGGAVAPAKSANAAPADPVPAPVVPVPIPMATSAAPVVTPATPVASPTTVAPAAIPVVPVVSTAPASESPASRSGEKPVAETLTPTEIERLRAASLAFTRATLERSPDPQVLRQRLEDIRQATAPINGKTAP